MPTLSEMLMSSTIGQSIGGLGRYLSEREATNGQQVKEQVGQQAAQLQSALADPNYAWQPNER